MLIFLKKILTFKSLKKKHIVLFIKKELKKVGFFNFIFKINKKYNIIFYNTYFINTIKFLYLGHLDIIKNNNNLYNPYKLFIYNLKLFGNGISDMKGNITSFIYSIKSKLFKKKHIILVLTGDEEKESFGAKFTRIFFIKKKVKFKYCIIGEPSSNLKNLDTIRNGRRGSLNLVFKFKGKQMHSAYSYNKRNSLYICLKYIKKINKLILYNKTKISFIYIRTFNNFMLNNITSKITIIKINIRYFYKENIFYLIKKINKTIKFKKIYILENSKPFFKKSIDFLKKIYLIKKIKINNMGGSSEGKFIYKFCKNIIELGNKNKYAHKINERINIIDLYKTKFFLIKVLKKC
ncbi:M20/M25/M40 family metallo-hydrolase [Candidatus Vidania fulgoroideorum]